MTVLARGRFLAVLVVPALFLIAACGGGGGSPTAPPPPVATPTPAPTPTPVSGLMALRSTTFQSANGYTTQGMAAIVRDGSAHRLELGADFRTSQSAALDVRLCRETRCQSGDLDLGTIQKFSGAQQYPLPDDGSAYRYAVIWCRGVNLPFGFGELR